MYFRNLNKLFNKDTIIFINYKLKIKKMQTVKSFVAKRNAKIKKRWANLHLKGLRASVIFDMIAEEFGVSPSQIYRILENVTELKGKTIDELNEM